MSHEMQVMTAFTQAREILLGLRVKVLGNNDWAYDKLRRVDEYLAGEQKRLGSQMFEGSEGND
jgi:hypothetical protein